MLKTGAEHLESLRDGRVVYIGSERVDDVTEHRAFRNAARSMAAIYDLKRADPAFSFAEGSERYSAYFLRARTRDDLQKRTVPRSTAIPGELHLGHERLQAPGKPDIQQGPE